MLCSGNLSAVCTGYVAEMRKEIGAYDVYNLCGNFDIIDWSLTHPSPSL